MEKKLAIVAVWLGDRLEGGVVDHGRAVVFFRNGHRDSSVRDLVRSRQSELCLPHAGTTSVSYC